jgi:uncharacterized protein YjiS (DUF1127 family)
MRALEERTERAGRAARFRILLGRTLFRLAAHVMSWDQRRRDRRWLVRLDDQALRDLGIDRATVENDSTMPFWRLR